MARRAGHLVHPSTIRKLRKTLRVLADTTPQTSFKEAEQYICPVCDLPVKPCEADSRAKCFHMLREGTELQSLFVSEKDAHKHCLSCGKRIPRKALLKNPTAELCSACARKSVRTHNRSRSKGKLP